MARHSGKRNHGLAGKPRGTVITKTIGETIMKEFLEIMGKDILSENFTRKEYVVYAIVAPLVLVLVCGLVSSLA
jgi:hypothetical protein